MTAYTDPRFTGAGWSSAPAVSAPFTYSTTPTYQTCAGCAAKAKPNEVKKVAEVEVGLLKVCGKHVKWALRVQKRIEEEDVD